MKRRDFLKILTAAPVVTVLPVLAAKKDTISLDDYQVITKIFDGKKPNSISNLTMWVKDEVTTTDGAGVTTWHDLSGNGNHLIKYNEAWGSH